MKKWFAFFVVALTALSSFRPAQPQEVDGVFFAPMPCELLPPMQTPRMAHALFCLDGELLAVGGHTTGFVSVSTAEYYKDGQWQQIKSLYPHDGAISLKLRNGQALVAGGYSGDFGIGQSFGVELFDPSTHSFSHLPILDRKRAHASALELEGGKILVAGNWYQPDEMEIYTPGDLFRVVKPVSQPRSCPWILHSAPDNALVFGVIDNYGELLQPIVVDRLNGEPFTVPLFDQWRPVFSHANNDPSSEFEIGNFSYLIPAENAEGDIAAMLVTGENFSLLPLEHSIPQTGPFGKIVYISRFHTDKKTETAWLQGTDFENRIYLVKISYGAALRGAKAPVSVYYTQPIETLFTAPPGAQRTELMYAAPTAVLMPDGRFAIAGGAGGYSMYDPTSLVCILSPGQEPLFQEAPWWKKVLGVLAVAVLLLLALIWHRRARRLRSASQPVSEEEDLQSRLVDLMEKKEYFRRKDARLSGVAAELGTNATYISAVVNGTTGKSFPYFLNGYRIRYAQQLMRKDPALPLHVVAEESGFPNETTFLRNFKAQTGLTPTEWKTNQ